jgi:hypothetical protein
MPSLKTLSNGPAPRPVGSALVVAVCAAASLGIMAQGANALTTYDSQVTCPIDGKPFKATMVGSFYQRGVRLDSKPTGSLIAPYPYPVCPGNGFVMYQNEFSQGELTAIRTIVLADEYQRLRREHTDYYMVAYVKQRLEGHDYDLGNMYLRASWEAEGNKPELARRYQALAIDRYDAFLRLDSSRSEDWWTASIVAAELNRLLGNFDAAEARLKSLPFAPTDVLMQLIDQIRMHARNHNSKPEELVFDAAGDAVDATVGSGSALRRE